MKVKQGLDYDDVLIIPKVSDIYSRDNVLLDSPVSVGYLPKYPVISAPMKGISGYNLVKRMDELNCIGILHRFDSIENRIEQIKNLTESKINFGVSIGTSGEEELDVLDYAVDNGVKLICIDTANGYLRRVASACDYIYKRYEGINIISGNVVTKEGADLLYESGVKFIRVGIGGGSLCSTRNVTGIGYPQLSAIESVASSKYADDFYLISDGGIKNSGNAVKSFAFGADFVMVGGLLANSIEAEHEGKITGMASKAIQEEHHTSIKSVEGLEKDISNQKRIPLEEIINEFLYGIRSACTYLNCKHYNQIQYKAEFISTGRGTLKDL
jgi:IMP dehydrogenase